MRIYVKTLALLAVAAVSGSVPSSAKAETVTVTLPDGSKLKVDKAKLQKLAAETKAPSGMATGSVAAQPPVAAGAGVDAKPAPKSAAKEIDWFDSWARGYRFPVQDLLLPGGVPERVPAKAANLTLVQDAFRLRKTWDSAKLFDYKQGEDGGFWQESETTGTASDGAEFGWRRDRINGGGKDQWNAQGVAYLPFVVKAAPDRQVLFIPSVEFNRDSSTDGTKNEINSLVARLGVDWNETTNGADGFQGWVTHFSLGYQTDFNFSSSQWLLDLRVERVDEQNGVGVYALHREGDGDSSPAWWPAALSSVLRPKLTLAPLFNLTHVSDVGDKEALRKLADDFATAGFHAGLDFEVEALRNVALLKGLKFGADYRWWSTLGAKSAQYDYLEAHVVAPFFGSGDKLSLTAFYRKGSMPDTLEKQDLMGLALTAKF